MYTSLEAMKLLEGIIDLYLADFRYGNDECARKYSDVKNYWQIITRNFELAYDTADVILRQLVLPGHLDCCAKPIMKWVSQKMPDVYFNLMFQYHPCYRASLYPEIDRRLTPEERERALALAKKYELNIS
jgi:putative pyruvate formate lyase activating enzyme